MPSRNVTITSKNQITIPAEYVRDLHLAERRVLRAELNNGKIVLTPQPSLNSLMHPFWNKHQAAHPLSDAEMKQAVRSIAAKRSAK